jgi:hypothetical protein
MHLREFQYAHGGISRETLRNFKMHLKEFQYAPEGISIFT